MQITALALGEKAVVVDEQLSSSVNDLFAADAVAAFSLNGCQTLGVEPLPATPVCLAAMLNVEEQIPRGNRQK